MKTFSQKIKEDYDKLDKVDFTKVYHYHEFEPLTSRQEKELDQALIEAHNHYDMTFRYSQLPHA